MRTVLRPTVHATSQLIHFEDEETEGQKNEIICLSRTAHGVPEIQTRSSYS